MKRLLAAVVLALALSAASAAASPVKHHGPQRHSRRHHPVSAKPSPTASAFAISARYWRQVPCSGHITLVYSPPPADDPATPTGLPVSMWASWDEGTTNENVETAPQPFQGCVIGVNREVWTSSYEEGYELWPDFAADMRHEFHHLMGYGDLFAPDDRGSIDYIEPSADVAWSGWFAPGWAPS